MAWKSIAMPVTARSLEQIAVDYHLAENMPDMFIENIAQEQSLTWVHAMLGAPGRLLELGHGDGVMSRQFVERGHELVVVDGAPSIVARARETLGAKATVIEGLFEAFESAKRFDYIVASHVLEHVDDPVALLKRSHAWLNPGGKLLVMVPNRESIHRQLALRMGMIATLDAPSKRDVIVGHLRVYSLDSLRLDLKAGGYRSMVEKGFFLKAVPNSMMLDYSPQLIEALHGVGDLLPDRYMANLGVVAERAT